MPLTTGSYTSVAPNIPESRDFWESPLHVHHSKYPDYGPFVHGEKFGGWDYERGWTYNSSTVPGTMYNYFIYGFDVADYGSALKYGHQSIRCSIAAASSIGADTGFWIMDEGGVRITTFAELNSGIKKGTRFNTQNAHASMSGVPNDYCETCVEGPAMRIHDITGSNQTFDASSIGALKIIAAQPGDRFTIYNMAPGKSNVQGVAPFTDPPYMQLNQQGMVTLGHDYSSSYFCYANGILAKRYFNFNIYETADNRSETVDDIGHTLKQKYIENGYLTQFIHGLNTSSSVNIGGFKQFIDKMYYGTHISWPRSSIEKWPYIPSDARSQILLKIPKNDELLNRGETWYDPDSAFSSSDWGLPARAQDRMGVIAGTTTAGRIKVPELEIPRNDMYGAGPMTYFIYTEATSSKGVRQIFDARPFNYDYKGEDDYLLSEEWNYSVGGRIPGYFHTTSNGIDTWMPAGNYTKMEAFAMAINHYCPWYTASYDASIDTGSIQIRSTMCRNRNPEFGIQTSDGLMWPIAAESLTLSASAAVYGNSVDGDGIHTSSIAYHPIHSGSDGQSGRNTIKWTVTQSRITDAGWINNIHTVKVAQLHKARHHDFRLDAPENYWRAIGSKAQFGGGQGHFEWEAHDLDPDKSIYDLHTLTASFISRTGPYSQSGWHANRLTFWEGQQSLTMPTSGSYNGSITKSGDTGSGYTGGQPPKGYGFEGFRSTVYTASMPVAKGYTSSSFKDNKDNQSAVSPHSHSIDVWSNIYTSSYNVKTFYYDWNHYNYSGIWKGVEIMPSRSYWIDEFSGSKAHFPTSIDTAQTFGGMESFTASNTWGLNSSYPTWIMGNDYEGFSSSGMLAQMTSSSAGFSNPNINLGKFWLRERPKDLEINNWGELNLKYSDYPDNCEVCNRNYGNNQFTPLHNQYGYLYTHKHLTVPNARFTNSFLGGQYGVNGVTPLAGHLGSRQTDGSGTINKKWWSLYKPQSIIMHHGDEISPMEWNRPITLANDNIYIRQVKRPTCQCTTLLDWRNYAITPFNPMNYNDQPQGPGVPGAQAPSEGLSEDKRGEHQFYKLYFSDGFSFTAGPYARLFSYDPYTIPPTSSNTASMSGSNYAVPVHRLNYIEGFTASNVSTSNVPFSSESIYWPHKLNSRTIREIAINTEAFVNNNTAAFITCNDLNPGTSMTAGHIYLVGIERLHAGYSWKNKKAQADIFANLRGLGPATNFNSALYENHFIFEGTGSECGTNLWFGNEIGGSLYPVLTHPRTKFPKQFFSASIFDGVIMLENGLYVGFESPVFLGHDAIGDPGGTELSMTSSWTSSLASISFDTNSVSEDLTPQSGDLFVHKSPYINFHATHSNKKWIAAGIAAPSMSELRYESIKPGLGCLEDTAFNFDPYASKHSDSECCVLFYHKFTSSVDAHNTPASGGDGITTGSSIGSGLFRAKYTQSLQTLYGWMTSSATGAYSDYETQPSITQFAKHILYAHRKNEIVGGGGLKPKMINYPSSQSSFITNVLPTWENLAAGIVEYPLSIASGAMSASWMNHHSNPPGNPLVSNAAMDKYGDTIGAAEFMDYDRMQKVGYIKIRPGEAGATDIQSWRGNITSWNQYKFGQAARNVSLYETGQHISFDGFKNLISLDIDTYTNLPNASNLQYQRFPHIMQRFGDNTKGPQGDTTNPFSGGATDFVMRNVDLSGITPKLKFLRLCGVGMTRFTLNNYGHVNYDNTYETDVDFVDHLYTGSNDRAKIQTVMGGNPNSGIEGDDIITSSLEHINLEDNCLKTINLGYLPNLRRGFFANQIRNSNYHFGTTVAHAPTQSFQSINLTGCRNLVELDVSFNQYKELNLTNNTKLEVLKAQGSAETTLQQGGDHFYDLGHNVRNLGWWMGENLIGTDTAINDGIGSGNQKIWPYLMDNVAMTCNSMYRIRGGSAIYHSFVLQGRGDSHGRLQKDWHGTSFSRSMAEWTQSSAMTVPDRATGMIARSMAGVYTRNWSSGGPAWLDLTNNKMLRELIIPGMGNFANRPFRKRDYAPHQNYWANNPTANNWHVQNNPMYLKGGFPSMSEPSGGIGPVFDDGAASAYGFTYPEWRDGEGMSGLQIAYSHSLHGGTHPHLDTLIAPFNYLEELNTKGMCRKDGTGSLNVLMVQCNRIRLSGSRTDDKAPHPGIDYPALSGLEIDGTGGNSLHTLYAHGNLLHHINMTDVGKWSSYGMDKSATASSSPTGSLIDLRLEDQLLYDPTMFTKSYIKDLKMMRIQNNRFTHFPLDETYGGWSSVGSTDKPEKLVSLWAFNFGPDDRIIYTSSLGNLNMVWYENNPSYGLPENPALYPPYFDSGDYGECFNSSIYCFSCNPGKISGIDESYLWRGARRRYDQQHPWVLETASMNPVYGESPYGAFHKRLVDPHWGMGNVGELNNFSGSFTCSSDWASELRELRISNTKISGYVNFNAASKLQYLVAAGNQLSRVRVDQCNELKALCMPYQHIWDNIDQEHHTASLFTDGYTQLKKADGVWPITSSGAVNLQSYAGLRLYGDTLTQVTMSGNNLSGNYAYPDLREINFEKNMALDYIDLRGINLANWKDNVDRMTNNWSGSFPSG